MNGEGVEGKETVVNTGGTAVETVVEMEVATVSAPLLTNFTNWGKILQVFRPIALKTIIKLRQTHFSTKNK